MLDAPTRLSRDWLAAASIHGLQCGSGTNLKAGCLNVDAMTFVDDLGRETPVGRVSLCNEAYLYLRHDANLPFPLDDATLSWVYAEHFIEHLERNQAVAWLAEIRRLLKPGGYVRVSTPDLAKYLSAYCAADSNFYDQHRERLRAMGMQQMANRKAWMVNQIFYYWGHRWIYDLEELTEAAVAAGFPPHCVMQTRFRQGRLKEVAEFDLSVRDDESLYVEIEKPAG